MADIFISYKSERRPAARHLKKVLECYFQNGADECVWYDYGLIPGDDFEPRIMAEIAKAKVVLVLWCGMAVNSPWVAKEANEAKRTNKFLPCRIEACTLPSDFACADTINLSEWDASPRDHKLDRLIEEVGRKLGREPTMDFHRMKELEETWRAYGAPSLVRFALSESLTPEAKEPPSAAAAAPILSPQAKPPPLAAVKAGGPRILGDPPKGLLHDFAPLWESARAGDAKALANIGILYNHGMKGLPKDHYEAVRLFKLAADQGNADGQLNLGLMYAFGLGGLAMDEREAVRLYKLAADQGNAGAQLNLASMYEGGRGGLPKDERETVRLYKLVADRGDAEAQTTLGWMYENGLCGLIKNRTAAVRLYKRAARRSKRAQSHLKRLGESW